MGQRGLRVRDRRRAARATCASGSAMTRVVRPRWACATARPRPPATWSRPRTSPRRWSPPRWSTASRTWPCGSRPRAWTSRPTWPPPARTQDGGRRRAAARPRWWPPRPTSPCGPSPRPRASRSTEEELDEELEKLAERVEQNPAEVRLALEEGDQLPAVRSDLRKRKALDWLVEHVADRRRRRRADRPGATCEVPEDDEDERPPKPSEATSERGSSDDGSGSQLPRPDRRRADQPG